jgi:predicted signal transduction protein with EAL and GGDEF domain
MDASGSVARSPGCAVPARPARPTKLDLVIAAAAVAAVAVVAVAVVLSWRQLGELSVWWRIGVVVVLGFLSRALPVTFRFSSHTVAFIWNEAAWVLGVALLPLPILAPALSFGLMCALVIRRSSPGKVVFNLSTTCISGFVGWFVLQLLSGGQTGRSLRFVLGLVLGAFVLGILQNLLTGAVITAGNGEPFSKFVRTGLPRELPETAGQVAWSVGLLALSFWWPQVLLLIPAGLLVISFTNRAQLRLQRSEDHSRQLDVAVRSLNQLDEQDVIDALVHGTADMLSAHSVEVTTVGQPRRRSSSSKQMTGSAASGPAGGTTVECELAFNGERLGTLKLRYTDRVALDDQEQRALSTLVSAASVAVLNARRHGEALHDAAHDPLTGLSNRRSLLTAGEELLADQPAALLLLDLDRFKEVNDTLGHTEGDLLLQHIADRIKRTVDGRSGPPRRGVRAPDSAEPVPAEPVPAEPVVAEPIVARLGGDEFAVLLPGWEGESAARIAERLVEAISQPSLVAGLTLAVGCSIGVAAAPSDGIAIDALLRCADVAMYQAKNDGGGVRQYDAGTDGGSIEQLLVEPELRATVLGRAIGNARPAGDIVLVFQPQFDLATGAPVGAEALVRWRHPRYGLLKPEAFMSTVERAGLQRSLTLRIIDAALAARAGWHGEHGVNIPVSVNLAAHDLLDATLPGDVAERLRAHRTTPDRLILEVPEAIVATEIGVVTSVMVELHELGVGLSLDGFGRGGGAPLALLAQAPLDEIKIDRSLVCRMASDPVAAAIVRSTVDLGRSLDLRTVAQGVEQASDAAALRAVGCDVAQGYRFARSLAVDETGRMLAETAASASAADTAPVIPLSAARRR